MLSSPLGCDFLICLIYNSAFTMHHNTLSFSFQKQQINHEEELLKVIDVSPYPQIQELIASKEPFDKLWRVVVAFNSRQDEWMNGSILQLNAEEIDEEVSK